MISFLSSTYTIRASLNDSLKVKPKRIIANIIFEGNKVTKPNIILREMNVSRGDSVNVSDIENILEYNKRRILNLNLFSRARYEYSYDSLGQLNIVYHLNELLFWEPVPIFSLADRNVNVWLFEMGAKLNRTNIGMELTKTNFRGRNELLGGVVQLGYKKYFKIFYKTPNLDKKLRHGFGASIIYETGREHFYETRDNKLLFYSSENYPYTRFQAKVSYTYRLGYASIHELELSNNQFSITQQLATLNPNFLGGTRKVNYMEAKYSYRFNNTDLRIYPSQGVEALFSIAKRGFGLTKEVNQFQLYADVSYYKSIYKNVSYGGSFLGRLSFPNIQPYFFDRAQGFKNQYVRGYEYYVIDGSHFSIIRNNIRYKIFDKIISQRLLPILKYIPLRIYGKAYDDLGYVYAAQPKNSFLDNRWLHGYGVGVDIVISYLTKIRVEYSFNHLNQNGLFLHGRKD